MGIVQRFNIASNDMDFKDKSDLYSRVKRLIHPQMMGESFKVIFAKNKTCNFSLAFK